MNLTPDLQAHSFADVAAKFPNLHAAVAWSFSGSVRRTEFAAITSFDEDTPGFTHQGFTEPELRLAFAAIMDETNWKLPMDRTFDRLRDWEREVVTAAAIFYAGTIPEFLDRTDAHGHRTVRVVGSGYYAEIGS